MNLDDHIWCIISWKCRKVNIFKSNLVWSSNDMNRVDTFTENIFEIYFYFKVRQWFHVIFAKKHRIIIFSAASRSWIPIWRILVRNCYIISSWTCRMGRGKNFLTRNSYFCFYEFSQLFLSCLKQHQINKQD